MAGRTARRRARTVAGQVFLLQVAIIVPLVAAAAVALLLQAKAAAEREARNRSIAVAEAFANSPGIVEALESPDPTAVLQPKAEEARKRGHVDFVVVLNRDGIRYTHPLPDRIGKKFVGDLGPALKGEVITEKITGTIGPLVQAVVPITDSDGQVVGMVSAGITIEHIAASVQGEVTLLLGATAGALLLALIGAAAVGRRLRRLTHGLGPEEMTRMYDHHDAVLHAVREGVLILSGDRRVMLANDEARRLLDLPPDPDGAEVTELGIEPPLSGLLASGGTATDEVYEVGDRALAVSQRPIDEAGALPGTVTTVRDTTLLQSETRRAERAGGRLRLLHDAGSEIGTTLDVVRTCQELTDFAAARFADHATVDLLPAVLRGEEPAPDQKYAPMRRVAGSGRPDGYRIRVAVPVRARGVVLGEAVFQRSADSAPFEEEDLSLAEELVTRAAVSIDNARRYTREHTMAVALQQSLLPHSLPEQDAVEAAYRYLPALAGAGGVGGVGGDWFDIIPLPGARVALVVGDVVGHGLHAAATMGRLRTAVHNFATLDLPPDELLWHLDELAARLDQDDPADGTDAGITGATCLYAVYDPLSGRCSIARAGHHQPVIVSPDGTAAFAEVPGGPPLGLGGMPFETLEMELAEDSRLVLYTDGLVEDRQRDIDEGLALLLATLSGRPGRTPEGICEDVLTAMLPERPEDDVALLVGRMLRLGPGQVARWEVPSVPAAVAGVRADVAAKLAEWGLAEEAFTTELILSELVTNAIRYTSGSIGVRLIRARSLICEVTDESLTSPHLRQAAITDEGGRGLFLVAQLAERWGTRYTAEGKVIWTEQPLPANGAAHRGSTVSG
ncbi:SpoIIE family protein phosphatase [Streptomyces sp. NPDC051940]|uniref:SpoIIE family protein phosphatase n=1 Tax=Streptomyces sp. NPDC051940 TaxID=3155675 RepID=UPI00343C373C